MSTLQPVEVKCPYCGLNSVEIEDRNIWGTHCNTQIDYRLNHTKYVQCKCGKIYVVEAAVVRVREHGERKS